MADIMDTIVDIPEEDTKPEPEVIDKGGTCVNPIDINETIEKAQKILSNIPDDKIEEAIEELNESMLESRKICTVKFLLDGKIGYRFDIYTHPERVDNLRVVELKNVFNMFNDVVPDTPKKVADFFKFVGVIKYIFPTTMFPIGDKVTEDSVVITIENNFNQYIKTAKIKGMEIKIDKD